MTARRMTRKGIELSTKCSTADSIFLETCFPARILLLNCLLQSALNTVNIPALLQKSLPHFVDRNSAPDSSSDSIVQMKLRVKLCLALFINKTIFAHCKKNSANAEQNHEIKQNN